MATGHPSRRSVLAGMGLVLGGLSGCLTQSSARTSSETATRSPTRRATASPRKPSGGRATTTASERPSEPAIPTGGTEPSWWTPRGAVLDSSESLETNWRAVDGTAVVRPAGVFDAESAAVLDSAGGRRIRFEREFATPRDFTDLDFSMGVRLDQTDKELVQVELWLVDVDGAHRRLSGSIQPDATDCWLRLDLGVRADGGADMGAIESLRVVHWAGGGHTRFGISDIRTHPKPEVGHVMLTFDDKGTTEYTDAFPILEEYGYAGASFPPIERVTHGSSPSIAEYREMHEHGWDIGGHTLEHEDLTEHTRGEQRAIIEENFRRLREEGLVGDSNHFRTTYSNYDTNTLELLPGPFDTAIIGNGSASGTNVHITDPRTIGFRSGDDLESAKADVDAAAAYRQLLGLTFHMANIDGKHLRRVVKHVHHHERKGRLRVLTPSDLYDEYIRP